MNFRFDKPPQEVIAQFQELKKAMIDASSIIYARKAGFISILQVNLRLITIPEIIAEAGDDADGIKTMDYMKTSESVDDKFVNCALQNNLPVISEDKKILTALKKTHLPFFNVLMMLNFLSYINAVNRHQYSRYLEALQEFAWYSPKIWAYGISVQSAIENQRS